VEASGSRDIARGPVVRGGHERYVGGLRKLTETVRRASNGRTKVLIQIIDFLTIRRRPTKEKFFGRYVVIGDEYRRRMAELLGQPQWIDADEATLRARL